MTKNKTDSGDKGHICPAGHAFFLDNWLRRLIQNPRKIVGNYIKEGDLVMDIGCGPGYFTVEMAEMVGKTGRVIAVDLQEKMLGKARKKAMEHHVSDCIQFHQCEQNRIGLQCQADFILAFYMVHETPNPKETLREMKQMLKSGGRLLVVEPKFHVSKEVFQSMLTLADAVGLQVVEFPKNMGGRAVLFSV